MSEVVSFYSDIAYGGARSETKSAIIPSRFLERPDQPVKISTNLKEHPDSLVWQNTIQHHISEISASSGFDIAISDKNSSRFIILIHDKSYVKSFSVNPTGNSLCNYLLLNYKNSNSKLGTREIDVASIEVGKNAYLHIPHCIRWAFVNLLGIQGKSDRIGPSTWNNYSVPKFRDPIENYDFSILDKMIIKAHLDPRLQAGMLREKALPIFRQIIIELWPEFVGGPAPVN